MTCSFLLHRKFRNYNPAVLHNRDQKKTVIGGSMVQACLLFCCLLLKHDVDDLLIRSFHAVAGESADIFDGILDAL